jgi:hypothetical protein
LKKLTDDAMSIKKKIGAIVIFLIILITGVFWFKPEKPLKEGMLIVTLVPAAADLTSDDFGIDGRYIPQARIAALDVDHRNQGAYLLTEDFYSARAPVVSYDGKEMVFSGQKEKGDLWQIYIKDLQTLQIRQVTHCPVNCTDPVWLPDGRLVFSRLNEEEMVGQIHVLYTSYPKGGQKERLLFHPNSAISPTVAMDGRILFLSEQKYPVRGQMHMLAMRIDGTKSELFYPGDPEALPVSRGWESKGGMVYFIEQIQSGNRGGRLVRVDYGHPLSSWEELSIGDNGVYHSVFPGKKGQLYVSFRPDDASNYGLYEFDSKTKKVGDERYMDADYHVIEPVLIQEKELPMQLPEIVDKTKQKGTLLCHDSDLSMIQTKNKSKTDNKTSKVQVFGLNEMFGEVEVEEDGSFYIEIDADMPVRFQTVNADGEILRGPSAWIWVRPNERRSCIGCHEDRELAPENRVPDALYGGMISLPDGTKTEPIVLTEK